MRTSFRRVRRAFVFMAVATALAVPVALAGDDFEQLDAQDQGAATYTPLSLSSQSGLYMIKLKGEPAAFAVDRKSAQETLKAAQSGLRDDIEALGGSVEGQYQLAYNGIKVRISADKVSALAALPGVVGVTPVGLMEPDHTNSVPLIGAPGVWDGVAGLHGVNVKVAIIDTGIDYTHANFGGPGTTAAFVTADAADTLPADTSLFGPAAPRIKGGIDLVGDDYNASAPAGSPALTPHPDPNPLDCNGHGSHVAGSTGGSGVLSNGSTYGGPYTASTIASNSWTIAPGVAPKVDLYAVRVFGCGGSTGVTIDAIEWAVENDMDVINMSLGSAFGTGDNASAEAASNAAKAGVVVVASAGNSGPNQYITGSPASGTGTISVAASDPVPIFPGAKIGLASGPIDAINANGHSFTSFTGQLAVIRTSYPSGPVSLGCSAADYAGYSGGVAGKITVTVRGTCSRVARAILSEQAGAIASIMIDNSTGFPPFEGPITGSAETGPFNVTIPFLGVKGLVTTATSDGGKLAAANGQTVAINAALLTNPNYLGFASFSSGGPRNGDSVLKPDITGPGVSIKSTLVGSGNGPLTISGTSMSSPHVAGVAALVRQANPNWKVNEIKAAIVNTGNPAAVTGFRISRGGSGLVQTGAATKTRVTAHGDTATSSLSFGLMEFGSDRTENRQIHLRNHGSDAATFTVSATNAQGSPHSVVVSPSTVTVPAGGEVDVDVQLTIPVATAGDSRSSGLSYREVAGLVTLTPVAGSNNGVTLRVPYLSVPRAHSKIGTQLASKLSPNSPSTTATSTNLGLISGAVDTYAWGLDDANDRLPTNDVRAVGAQSFAADFPFPIAGMPAQANERFVVFAINTWSSSSNHATTEYDIAVDVDGNGTRDYIVVAADQGLLQGTGFVGRTAVAVFKGDGTSGTIVFLATDKTDSGTILVPLITRQLCRTGSPCLSASNPRLSYSVTAFDLRRSGSNDAVAGTAAFNPWTNAITTGAFATIAGGTSASFPVSVNAAEWARTPAKGLMIVTLDNKNGRDEADLIAVPFK